MAHIELIYELITLFNGSFEEHYDKLGNILVLVQNPGLKCSAEKFKLCSDPVECIDQFLTTEKIRSMTNTVMHSCSKITKQCTNI